MSIQYILTDRSLTFMVGATPYQVDRSVGTFDEIVAEINAPEPDSAKLVDLANRSRAVQREISQAVVKAGEAEYLRKGVIAVDRTGVTFNGEPLHNALADRLMDLLNSGFKLAPWVKFAENLYMNPAEHAREELYLWLEKADLPITEDGHFLAYKKVRADFKDIHSGTFDNSVGQIVQLSAGRAAVDSNRDRTCSNGLHFCSKEYLPQFGSATGNKVVIVKVNPADVVSIPSDYDNTKGRTWRYEVVAEIPYEDVFDKAWDPVWSDNDDDDFDGSEDEGGFYNAYGEWISTEDDAPEEVDEDAVYDEAFAVEKARLDALSIVALRPLASKAGLNSQLAWKVYSKPQLSDYLAALAAERAVEAAYAV